MTNPTETREAVAPSKSALKLAQQKGGATGELCERIAWALDPEAFQIWEREDERTSMLPMRGPTWEQMAVHGRRAKARATAEMLVAGPVSAHLAPRDAKIESLRARAEEAERALEQEGEALELEVELHGEASADLTTALSEVSRLTSALEREGEALQEEIELHAEASAQIATLRAERDAALARAEEAEERHDGRFWLELREPGCVPERKGAFPRSSLVKTLREFMDARPTALLTVVTIGNSGPDFQHGPEALQMADARSMVRGSTHNARVRAAHCNHATEAALSEVSRLTAALAESERQGAVMREALAMARLSALQHVEAFRPWTEKIAGRINPWQPTLDAVEAALTLKEPTHEH